jgi:hypothetical protein
MAGLLGSSGHDAAPPSRLWLPFLLVEIMMQTFIISFFLHVYMYFFFHSSRYNVRPHNGYRQNGHNGHNGFKHIFVLVYVYQNFSLIIRRWNNVAR